MGLGFLFALRILLVLLAFIIFIMAVHYVRVYRSPIYEEMGLTVFLAIFSGIAHGWALKAQVAKRNHQIERSPLHRLVQPLRRLGVFSRLHTLRD
jgi:hypothetical protein